MAFIESIKKTFKQLGKKNEDPLLVAWEMISNRKFNDAREKLSKTIIPENVRHRKIFLEAIIDYYQNNHQESLFKLESIEKPDFLSDPFLLSFYEHKGYNLEKLNRYKEAIEAFNTSIEAKESVIPDHYIIFQHRGNSYHRLKKYENAIKDFETSINLKPLAETYHNKALSLFASKRFDSALENFDRSIELSQEIPTFFFNRMKLHIEMKNWAPAINDADILLAKNSYENEALLYRGTAKCHTGNIKDGLRDLQLVKGGALYEEAQKLIAKYEFHN